MAKINGIDKVIKELKSFGKDAEKEIDDVMDAVSQDIAKKARQELTAFRTGKLLQSIRSDKQSDMHYIISAGQGAPYAPYIEYGTGGFVQVPKEFKDEALLSKGKGIRQVNIQARPFMYPAFVYGKTQLLKELKASLERLAKKV